MYGDFSGGKGILFYTHDINTTALLVSMSELAGMFSLYQAFHIPNEILLFSC